MISVKLTRRERKDNPNVEAITFDVKNGDVIIGQIWVVQEEIWTDKYNIRIPARIWAIGMKWMVEQTT